MDNQELQDQVDELNRSGWDVYLKARRAINSGIDSDPRLWAELEHALDALYVALLPPKS